MSVAANILNKFIVFEGLDGSGTSTQCALLGDYFKSTGINAYLTAEPTNSSIGKFIRSEFLSGKISINPQSLLYLFSSDRCEHLYSNDGIISHLSKSKIVVSDRYKYSTFAYQGLNLDFKLIMDVNSSFPDPEILIYINTPVEECLNRILKRGEKVEIFEKKDTLFKVKENFEKVFNNLPNSVNFIEIDGALPATVVFSKVIEFIKKVFGF